eukprot:m.1461316 g.1461316  ORF g.1461316 m.1461316 type:complete len:79 (-) comp25131_c0_seq10:125-361(-)
MEGRQYHRPGDTEHAPTRTFYENEVMLSTVASIFDMRKIIRKCAVLSVADYQVCCTHGMAVVCTGACGRVVAAGWLRG